MLRMIKVFKIPPAVVDMVLLAVIPFMAGHVIWMWATDLSEKIFDMSFDIEEAVCVCLFSAFCGSFLMVLYSFLCHWMPRLWAWLVLPCIQAELELGPLMMILLLHACAAGS
jgi:hypothetical protein